MSYSAAKGSKFRHIFGEPKREQFLLKGIANPAGEGKGVWGNTKWFAASMGSGGGKLAVVPYSMVGQRGVTNMPAVTGHAGKILDADFCPFDENQLVTGAEDCMVKAWQIPEDFKEGHINEPICELSGHQKKVNIVRYHPSAENIVASASHDSTIRLWDLTRGEHVYEASAGGEMITFSLSFNGVGNQYVTCNKDKLMRIFDARTGKEAASAQGHEGAKAQMATWMTKKDLIATVGFNKQSTRQVWLWDPRNMSQKIGGFDIDTGAGVFMPMYDPDTELLFLAAKGDSTIFWTEVNDANELIRVGDFKPPGPPLKGVCMLPKMAGDVMKCEVARLLRIRGDENMEILPMIVPRKSTEFQADIFPDTAGPEPGCSAEEWLGGSDKARALVSAKPGSASAAPKRVIKTPAQYEKELKEKDAKIAELEAKIKELMK